MKKTLLLLISTIMLLSSIFATSVSAYSPEEIPVIFTADSEAVEGGKLTVDILAMTDYDSTIYNAWLENDVKYEWHKDDVIVLENTTDTYEFTAQDVGHEFYVLVTCWDYTMKSENFVVVSASSAISPVITTKSLPEAYVGKEYYVKIESADPDATFGIYYNPGKDNEFEDTGLILTQHGEIEGIPEKAGTYGFTVAAYGEGGEEYAVYVLKVLELPDDESSAESLPADDEGSSTSSEAASDAESSQIAESSEVIEPSESSSAASSATESQSDDKADDKAEKDGISLWVVVIIAIAAAGVGATVALVVKKKS